MLAIKKELMKNRLIGFFPLLMIVGSLFVQEQDSYIFHHFSIADGLLNNEVKAVIRDRCLFLKSIASLSIAISCIIC